MWDGKVMLGDPELDHFDVLSASGRTLRALGKLLLDSYEFERRGLCILLIGGMVDLLRKRSFERMTQDVQEIRNMLSELDDKHGRQGVCRSKLILASLPMCPKMVNLPKDGLSSKTDDWVTEDAERLINWNYWVETDNKKNYPSVFVPTFLSLGHKSKKKVYYGRVSKNRKWSLRSNIWRKEEGPNAVHLSNKGMRLMIETARGFLTKLVRRYEEHLPTPKEKLVITRKSLGLDFGMGICSEEACEVWQVDSSA